MLASNLERGRDNMVQTELPSHADAISTSFPGSSLFLPRESTLVAAGHVSMYTNQIRTGGGSLTLLCQNCPMMEEKVALPHRRYFES